MKILSVNSGSSSLKFRLYEMPEEKLLMKGMLERIGTKDSSYNIRIGEEKLQGQVSLPDYDRAVQFLLDQLLKSGLMASLDEIGAVGHRVVHGGNLYSHSVKITERVMQEIEAISDLAPLHNPVHVLGMRAFAKEIPNTLMVACFDTAFHQTMAEKNYLYALPFEWYTKYNVRKYGFHGLSHQFITNEMQKRLGKNDVNLIICHLGNGASVSAVKGGICIDTSMGFTPNAGLIMGTRCGDVDATIIGYIQKKTGMSPEEIDHVLNFESGLQGIAGMNDLRDLDCAYLAKEQKALLAYDMYTERIMEYIAKYYVKLGGQVDAICFTAGGGENDPIIRGETLRKLAPLGVILDEKVNDEMLTRTGKEGIITTKESTIPAYVLATDEELIIARDAYRIKSGSETF